MKKRIILFSLSLLAVAFFFSQLLSSCKKTTDKWDGINEPITFLSPDTNWLTLRKGESLSLRIQLTTDRVIDSLVCAGNLDTLRTGFDPLSDPTFPVFTQRYWPDSIHNIQTYEGVYQVPSDAFISRGDAIRLLFTMYAKDGLKYDKILRIDIK